MIHLQSKRAKARREEAAQWKKKDKTSKRRKKSSDVNTSWERVAHYVPAVGRTASLKDQPKQLRVVLKGAIESVEGDMIFINFYPTMASLDSYFAKVLKEHAKKEGYNALACQASKDADFCETFAPLVTYFCTLRCS